MSRLVRSTPSETRRCSSGSNFANPLVGRSCAAPVDQETYHPAAHSNSDSSSRCDTRGYTIALGRAAIREGYSVLFVTAPALVAALAKAHAEGRLDERLGFFAKPKLLIVDELGYPPFETNAAHLFFQLVSRRYERGSVLITSNRSVGEWGSVFGDPGGGHGDPRPAAAPQSGHHYPRRQLSPAREAPLRPDQGRSGRCCGGRVSPWIIVR